MAGRALLVETSTTRNAAYFERRPLDDSTSRPSASPAPRQIDGASYGIIRDSLVTVAQAQVGGHGSVWVGSNRHGSAPVQPYTVTECGGSRRAAQPDALAMTSAACARSYVHFHFAAAPWKRRSLRLECFLLAGRSLGWGHYLVLFTGAIYEATALAVKKSRAADCISLSARASGADR